METPVHVLFIIDASGSMLPRAEDVRGGFNSYIEGLRADTTGHYRVSAVTFDTQVRNLFTELDLDDVPALTTQNYKVGGNTALYDAIGMSLNLLTKKLAVPGKPYGEERVVCIIMTDGEENSSRTFEKTTIVDKIARRTKSDTWTFVYLGADQDAWQIAQGLGMYQGNTMSYDGASTRAVFDNLVGQTIQYSQSNTTSSATFTTGGGLVGTSNSTTTHAAFVPTADAPPIVSQAEIDQAQPEGDDEGEN